MGLGVNKNLLIKLGACLCALLVGLPQAYAIESTDPLVTVSCPISTESEKAAGVLLGTVPFPAFALIMRASEHYTLQKKLAADQNVIRLLREFIAAQEALDAAKARLQAVYKEMLQIITSNNLADKIRELKAENLRTSGRVGINFEELFGDKKNQPFAIRYNALTIERAVLEASTVTRAGFPAPTLQRKVFEALARLNANNMVSKISYDAGRPILKARNVLQNYELRAQKLASKSDSLRLGSSAKIGIGGVLIVAGIALFYSDDISYFFKPNPGVEKLAVVVEEETKTLAENLKCLISNFEQQEDIQPLADPVAQKLSPEIYEVVAGLRANGMIND